jgi:hypothetical protein
MSIELYEIVSPVILSYDNATGPITLSPPTGTEVPVASITMSVEAGHHLKIDYALNIVATTTANWSLAFELHLYRGITLINTRFYNRVGSQAGDQYIPFSSTYVDTVPAGSTTLTYVLKGIVTVASNASPVKTGVTIDMNIISFS